MSAAADWAGAHPALAAPIIRARHVERLRASRDAVHFAMTPQSRAQIAAPSRTPPPATDRVEERGQKAA